ncbi:hypothetical protein JOC33_002672 [Thalassobacillus pellis]|nr:hypothetical protein [Thalassobacillus pellis]
MQKSEEHRLYKLIGTSKKYGQITCYVLYNSRIFYLDHVLYEKNFTNIWDAKLIRYLCSLEEDILNGVFDDHRKTELHIQYREALLLV